MDGLRQWAIAVCTAALLCTVLRHLFSDHGPGQQGRMLLSCVFLCALLSPLPRLFSDVKLPSFTAENPVDSADLTELMRLQMEEQVNDTLLRMVNQSLSGYGWSARKVMADVDIAEDGSIHMGQIFLYVDETTARRATAVQQVAEKRLGTAVEVVVWESENG